MASDNRSKSTTQNNSTKGDNKKTGDTARTADTKNKSSNAEDEPKIAYGPSGAKDSH